MRKSITQPIYKNRSEPLRDVPDHPLRSRDHSNFLLRSKTAGIDRAGDLIDVVANGGQQAEAAGLKKEPFVRTLIMGVNLRPRPPDEYARLLTQVSILRSV